MYNIIMEKRIIKAVLFDLDGTIIDTEKYYRKNWPKTFASFGYSITDEQGLKLRSLGSPYAEEYLKKLFGEDIDVEAIKKYARSLVDEDVKKNGIEVKPGVMSCLKFLRSKNIKVAIVTATAVERTKRYVDEIGLSAYFDDIISAKDVKCGKPAPDVYLTACEKLNIKPENTIAVEDSPNGVMSASRAGCNTVMVPDQTEPDDELKEYIFVTLKSLNDFESMVKTQSIEFSNV